MHDESDDGGILASLLRSGRAAWVLGVLFASAGITLPRAQSRHQWRRPGRAGHAARPRRGHGLRVLDPAQELGRPLGATRCAANAMIQDIQGLWNNLITLIGQIISPDWGAVISWVPYLLALLVLVGLAFIVLRWTTNRVWTASRLPARRTTPAAAARDAHPRPLAVALRGADRGGHHALRPRLEDRPHRAADGRPDDRRGQARPDGGRRRAVQPARAAAGAPRRGRRDHRLVSRRAPRVGAGRPGPRRTRGGARPGGGRAGPAARRAPAGPQPLAALRAGRRGGRPARARPQPRARGRRHPHGRAGDRGLVPGCAP